MKYIKDYADLHVGDASEAGDDHALLGELSSALAQHGVRIPSGFVVTAAAYRDLLASNGLDQRIRELLGRVDLRDQRQLAQASHGIRSWILHATPPAELVADLSSACRNLRARHSESVEFCVHGSAIGGVARAAASSADLESQLAIRGTEHLLHACRRVYASLFSSQAISRRADQGMPLDGTCACLAISQQVDASHGASGVLFNHDPDGHCADGMLITALPGLGEPQILGDGDSDEYGVFKPLLSDNHRPIIYRLRGAKSAKAVTTGDGAAGCATRIISTTAAERQSFVLNDDSILKLARQAATIEKYLADTHRWEGLLRMEWSRDAVSGDLFITRVTRHDANRDENEYRQVSIKSTSQMIAEGRAIGGGIVAGSARVLLDPLQAHTFRPGEILVTESPDPTWEPLLRSAAGLVTDRGNRGSALADVARRLGIPVISGTGDACQRLRDGQELTLDCSNGGNGRIYEGKLQFEVSVTDLRTLPQPRTHVMLNLADPGQACALSQLPVDGVGLLRLEYIIGRDIGVHPAALLAYEQQEPAVQRQITPLLHGYANPREFFVHRLTEGIARIAAAFFPRPVIVRLSDFKSSEYAALLGGENFEPQEANPLLGWRGSSRYYDEHFAQCFILECLALRRVRETLGLANVAVMIPFARTVQEGCNVLDIMASQGLVRGEKGLQVFLMCEVPANIILAERFLEHFDGYSIGSNDLTQLTLGVDRESGLLTGFDEHDPAVLKLMEIAIDACRKRDKYIGICGNAPSQFSDITRWLVQRGIRAISFNPDSVLGMLRTVAATEQQLAARD